MDTPQRPTAVLQRFRKPEYTGENRCLPCTVLNTGIALVLSVAIALVSVTAAVVVFAACALVITLWGYLIPGTPRLVRYLPDTVHEAIGPEHDFDTDEQVSFDVEETLTSADIVRECRDVDDLCLTRSYREAFHEELDRVREESVQRRRLAASLSVPAEDIEFDESGTRLDVFVDDIRAGGWRSKAAFVTDLASEHLLSERLGARWENLPATERSQLLVALRSFVETCPACGGDVVPDEDVVRSCCRDDIVSVTTTCEGCGAVLFKGTEA
ncbi:MAG: hypothetical protein ACI9K3_001647 [Halovenus sp.]|jgi:hypothetical protein